MLNRKGFTLIETLFVVFIITILSSLTFTYKKIIFKNDDLQTISNFFNHAQTLSISFKEKVHVLVKENTIQIISENHKEKLVLNENIYFMKEHQFSYNKFGHIYKAKTLVLKTPKKTYSFVFQIGSGQFYVK